MTDSDFIYHVLATVIKNHVGGSERDHLEEFRFEVAKSERLRNAIINYAFENRYPLIRDRVQLAPSGDKVTILPRATEGRAAPTKPTKPYTRRETPDVSDIISALKETVLMNTILPGGKLLRDATFGECRKLSGWLRDVGMSHPANQIVGRQLREADLQRLLDRQAEPKAKTVKRKKAA